MTSEEQRERNELAELAQAIGARQLELKFGQPLVYQCALNDVLAMAQARALKSKKAQP